MTSTEPELAAFVCRQVVDVHGIPASALFTASPRVVLHEQAGAGHNTSVGRTALAYHLHVPAFVEECALGVRALPTEKGLRDG